MKTRKDRRPPRRPKPLPQGAFEVIWPSLQPLQIVPGQDLTFVWSLSTLAAVDLVFVTASIYLERWPGPVATSKDVKLLDGGQPWIKSTGDQTQLVPALGPGGLANDLYAIGTHVLRLEVTSSKTGQLFTAKADLTVVADSPPIWIWNPPEGTKDESLPDVPQVPLRPLHYNLLIHHDYALSGRLLSAANSTQRLALSMSGKATLMELRPDGGASIPIESQPFNLLPGQSSPTSGTPVVFNTRFNKNWTWLVPAVWIINPLESLEKRWCYGVTLTYADNYNNVYAGVDVSLPMWINVGVDDTKKGFAAGALAALAVGAVLAIFTFGAAAGVAQAIAGGLGAKALDPPLPDPRYARAVVLPASHTPAHAEGAASTIAALLASCEDLVDLIRASDDTLNRVLGAMTASDNAAIARQTKALGRIETTLVRKFQTIAEQWEGFAARIPKFDTDDIERTLRKWQSQGLSRTAVKTLESAGVSDTAIRTLAEAVQQDELIAAATNVQGAMARILFALWRGAGYSLGRTRAVLQARRRR